MVDRIKRGLAVLLIVISLSLLFLPLFQLHAAGRVYLPTGLRIIVSALAYNQLIIHFPPMLRIMTAVMLIGLAGALVLALLKKTGLAAAASATAAAAAVLVQVMSAELTTIVKNLGLGKATMEVRSPLQLLLWFSLLASILLAWSEGAERLARSIFRIFSFVSVASVATLSIYMLFAGLPAIIEIGPVNFLLSSVWKPINAVNPQFGILNMILATLAATIGSIIIGVPLGLLTAVFLAELAPRRVATLVRPAVQLLAGIPSVIYGFFGLQMLVPLVQKVFKLPTGSTLFSAIIILAIMIMPTIVSTAETGLRAVPAGYREASLAVGATQIETIFRVVVPAARSSILSGVILGVGRSVGETMAVIMVAGNMPNVPALFGTVRPLTVGIALEMSYATGLHRSSLFAIGLVLFVFIMLINLTFSWISRKGVQMDGQNE